MDANKMPAIVPKDTPSAFLPSMITSAPLAALHRIAAPPIHGVTGIATKWQLPKIDADDTKADVAPVNAFSADVAFVAVWRQKRWVGVVAKRRISLLNLKQKRLQ
jgi:hypothetical protein